MTLTVSDVSPVCDKEVIGSTKEVLWILMRLG